MKTSEVSFGRVVAVYAKPKKMTKVNKKLFPQTKTGKVMIKDITSMYKHVSSAGEMAQAAQRGDSIELYITGDDVSKVVQKQSGWKSIKEILGNIDEYFDASQMFVSDIVDNILAKKK